MNTITTAPARLRITHAECDGALIRFRFDPAPGDPDPDDPLLIPCAHLAGPRLGEFWCADTISESAETCGAAWAHGEDYAMVAISVAEDEAVDIERAAELAYERLITCVRPSEHPYLARIWNYFSAINEGDGDGERYRRFCVGRARGVDGRFNDPPPAATAIGASRATGRLQVIALCSRTPGHRPGESAADAGLALSTRVRPGIARFFPGRAARCRQPVAAPARLGHRQHRRPRLAAHRRRRRATGREPRQSRGPARRRLGAAPVANFRWPAAKRSACTCAIREDLPSPRASSSARCYRPSAWCTCTAMSAGASCRSNSKACSSRATSRRVPPRPARGRSAGPTGAARGRCSSRWRGRAAPR